jgi:hypothetical protein
MLLDLTIGVIELYLSIRKLILGKLSFLFVLINLIKKPLTLILKSLYLIIKFFNLIIPLNKYLRYTFHLFFQPDSFFFILFNLFLESVFLFLILGFLLFLTSKHILKFFNTFNFINFLFLGVGEVTFNVLNFIFLKFNFFIRDFKIELGAFVVVREVRMFLLGLAKVDT